MTTFHETQKYNPWWMWLLKIGLSLTLVYGLYQKAIGEPNLTNDGYAGWLMIGMPALILGLILWKFRLKTDIDEKGIRIRVPFLVDRFFEWEEVVNIWVCEYSFSQRWGIPPETENRTEYSTGTHRLYIEVMNGENFLIGTSKPEELRKLIAQYINTGVISQDDSIGDGFTLFTVGMEEELRKLLPRFEKVFEVDLHFHNEEWEVIESVEENGEIYVSISRIQTESPIPGINDIFHSISIAVKLNRTRPDAYFDEVGWKLHREFKTPVHLMGFMFPDEDSTQGHLITTQVYNEEKA